MKSVKVKGKGVYVNGKSYFKDDIFDINEEDYELIKEYVEVLREDAIKEKNVITIKIEEDNVDIKELTKELEKHCKDYINNLKEQKEQKEKAIKENEELEKLREKAKELGIKNVNRIGKDKLIEFIKEKEAPVFGEEGQNQNPKGE